MQTYNCMPNILGYRQSFKVIYFSKNTCCLSTGFAGSKRYQIKKKQTILTSMLLLKQICIQLLSDILDFVNVQIEWNGIFYNQQSVNHDEPSGAHENSCQKKILLKGHKNEKKYPFPPLKQNEL
ncbi:hypothetical protein RF11_13444 [Thelohanellus kitauei]|uniref:Uncharacterized protein n=1 Tax=Thelohanellus kitauei TaxID=669202 RepID=A0A0C2J1Y0_THEKT|nr:hypothetical protein RF11_13444 [Thelohanellus kitauei]